MATYKRVANSHSVVLKSLVIFTIFLVVASVFFFWRLDRLPSDVDGEVCLMGSSALLLLKSKELNKPAIQMLKSYHFTWQPAQGFGNYLEMLAFSKPLWHILFLFVYKGLSEPLISLTVSSALIGFFTAALTFWVGLKMYGRAVGFLAALLLSSSLFFLIHTRACFGYQGLCTLTLLLTLYLFYRAYESRRKGHLWFAGIAAGICWFSGYIVIYLLPLILIGFVVFNIGIGRIRLFGKSAEEREANSQLVFSVKDYLKVTLIALVVCMILSVGYSVYFDASPLSTFCNIHLVIVRMAERSSILQSSFSEKIGNFVFLLRNTFVKMDFSGFTHTVLELPGKPMVAPFPALFLIIGLLIATRVNTLADRLCLTWMGVIFFVFSFLSRFEGRYILPAAPAIYLLSARGMVWFVQSLCSKVLVFTSSGFFKRISKALMWSIIAVGLCWTMYSTYNDLFITYARKDGNLLRYHGQSQIARYVVNRSKPQECQVVLGEKYLTPYDCFFFYTAGESYPVVFWDDLMRLKKGDRVAFLSRWEREILVDRENIFYIFAIGLYSNRMPGYTLWGQPDWTAFRCLHPTLQPARTIYFSDGIPALAIYVVSKSTPRYKSLVWDMTTTLEKVVCAESETPIDAVWVEGLPKKPSIVRNGREFFQLPVDVGCEGQARITYDENSELEFNLLSGNFKQDIYRQNNVEFFSLGEHSGIRLARGGRGYITYKFEFPFPVRKLKLIANPRIFNDREKKNHLAISFSSDNEHFSCIYEKTSNGSGEWTEPYTQETLRTFYPSEGKAVYIKLSLRSSGGFTDGSAFWACDIHPMLLMAQFDSSSLSRPILKSGMNILTSYQSEDNVANLILFMREDERVLFK